MPVLDPDPDPMKNFRFQIQQSKKVQISNPAHKQKSEKTLIGKKLCILCYELRSILLDAMNLSVGQSVDMPGIRVLAPGIYAGQSGSLPASHSHFQITHCNPINQSGNLQRQVELHLSGGVNIWKLDKYFIKREHQKQIHYLPRVLFYFKCISLRFHIRI